MGSRIISCCSSLGRDAMDVVIHRGGHGGMAEVRMKNEE
jgi:hypothetical protein